MGAIDGFGVDDAEGVGFGVGWDLEDWRLEKEETVRGDTADGLFEVEVVGYEVVVYEVVDIDYGGGGGGGGGWIASEIFRVEKLALGGRLLKS